MVGLPPEFCSEKIPRNRLGAVFVIPQKKVLILRSTEGSILKLGTERNSVKKISFSKLSKTLKSYLFAVPQLLSFLKIFSKFVAAEFCCEVHCCQPARWPISEPHNSKVAVFSSAKCSRTKFRKFASFLSHGMEFRDVFLFLYMLRNKKSKVCCYFCSKVRNSKHFFLPRNGSEENSGNFLFCGTSEIPL